MSHSAAVGVDIFIQYLFGILIWEVVQYLGETVDHQFLTLLEVLNPTSFIYPF